MINISFVDILLQASVFGIEFRSLLAAAAVFVVVYAALWLTSRLFISRLRKIAEKTHHKIDDAIVDAIMEVKSPAYLLLSLYAAVQFIAVPEFIVDFTRVAVLAVVAFYAVRMLQKLLLFFTNEYIEKQPEARKRDPSIIMFASKAASFLLWLLAFLLVIDNAGYDISALVAGLGVAGIAVALAVQNILGDMFSSLSIYFDKPFKAGDFIIVGSEMGTVKKIGIKTTRIDALQGEEIVISNKELTESRIHNFGKMSKRRVQFGFGILYETPLQKVKKVNELVKKSVEKVEGATLDRAHFKTFGDSSLQFEVVYYVPTGDYNKYMDAQQAINHSLMELFRKEGIEFAYPTQKIYLAK
ncbi:MAG: mechanosensitive ion channel family protein [Candidatus Diapherotrites archaeon]|uniref:Mechanosensitive ion channel family protein n=1 Tax=Candidatus Iainarchaeum sp. TaxID=3101447 RepID=A0A8T3YMF5_9ARCH|nr:mechanosensitive ion channel family protein [Candidatus Diapherotrites archaeon]